MLQPRTLGFLNHIVPSVLAFNISCMMCPAQWLTLNNAYFVREMWFIDFSCMLAAVAIYYLCSQDITLHYITFQVFHWIQKVEYTGSYILVMYNNSLPKTCMMYRIVYTKHVPGCSIFSTVWLDYKLLHVLRSYNSYITVKIFRLL